MARYVSTIATYLFCAGERLLSLGYDCAMRLIDIRNLQVVSGGRLSKRLENAYLTTGILVNHHVVLGSSEGDIIIYGIASNPPQFRSQCRVTSKSSVNEFSFFSEDDLLVAHGDCVSVYSVATDSADCVITRRFDLRCLYQSPEVTLQSCSSNPHYVFGAYSNGSVVAWDWIEKEPIFAVRAHEKGCRRVKWVEPPWGPGFITGGGDGKLKSWTFPDTGYEIWHPQKSEEVDCKTIGRDDIDVYEKQNSNCLVSHYTHHGGDSDEDSEVILDSFRLLN